MRRILLLVFILLVALTQGCAFKKISDLPPADQSVEYSIILMESWKATYHQYNQIKPSLTADQKILAADFVQAMNLAKPCILEATRCAELWKIATADHSAEAERIYRQQSQIAADMLKEAMNIWKKLRGARE
ncbi:hypothetical protein [Maridesulfovibrio sp.]|uniref:hypothetical protein n=1 Tax=Maridesulfovibrio sp. TaxID=2795000 RepID=UPI0029C9FD68|nr:hypothetical protein [Maridesulfovibrio sp.]